MMTKTAIFFSYVAGVFYINVRKGGVLVESIPRGAGWNGDPCDGTGPSGFNLNPEFNNQFKITYGWLGVMPATFSVYGGRLRGWIVCHVFDPTNSQITPSTYSPNFNIRWTAARTSGTGAVTLAVGCVAGGSTEGVHAHAGHRTFAGRVAKTIPGGATMAHLATFRSKTLFQGRVNKIRSEATWSAFSCDGAKNTEFLLYRNAILDAAALAGFVDVDTANSIFDVTQAGAATGGTFEMSFPLAKVDHDRADLGAGHVHLELMPGETMSLMALSASSSETVSSFRWEEFFA